MKDTIKDWLKFFALVLLFFCIGFIGGVILRRSIKPVKVEVVHTDTLTIRDTIMLEKPVYVTQRVVDSIFIPVRDTMHHHDTVFIALPRMQREYPGSTYRAWVSGYEPQLDSIEVYSETLSVTKTVQRPGKHWHIGITGGYGATVRGDKVMLSPYVGVGVTYSIFSF